MVGEAVAGQWGQKGKLKLHFFLFWGGGGDGDDESGGDHGDVGLSKRREISEWN